MKAAVYEEFGGPIEVRDVPDPDPHPDGVVIRVEANGICRSDWHGWMGHDPDVTLPHVPGHELAGVVEAAGADVSRFRPGDRVTAPFSCGCGRCELCASGQQQICDDYFQPGFTAWGSFAELVALRYADANLVRLPESMGFVEAAGLGCRFVTAFRAVVAQGRVAPGEWVAVHGCGGVGLAAIMIAKAYGAEVVGIDIREPALEIARALGAVGLLAEPGRDVPEAVRELTRGGAHLSVDALGSSETCRNSVLGLRKRGRHVQVGVMAAEHRETAIPMGRVMSAELELIGSHGMSAQAYGPLLEMVAGGRLDPGRLVTETVTLTESIGILTSMDVTPPTGAVVIDRFR